MGSMAGGAGASSALRAGGESAMVRQVRYRIMGLAALAALAMAAVAVLTVSVSGPAPRNVLFALDPDELAVNNDAILQSLAVTPGKAAKAWGKVASMALSSADTDGKMLKKAQADEDEANELAGDDQAQLQALYSGTFNTGDSLGVHTGSLGNYDTLQALQNLPKTAGSDLSNDYGDLSAVTQTQLNGLNSELQSLASTKQSIVNSLKLQRQSTAAKMASDSMYANHIRLNRATATTSSRQLRAAMRAAQMAEQRAREASVIQANQDAIARLQMQRVASLQAHNQQALAAAANAESQLRAAEAYKRAMVDNRYHSAMAGYTSSLQGSVADDMLTLNRLKVAEEAAAPGPHVISSVWEQPPTGSTLPDVDPNLFMNDAPLRDIDSLTDAEYTQKGGTTELAQAGAAKTQQLASMPQAKQLKRPMKAHPRAPKKAHHSPFIMRVMAQADQELRALKNTKVRQQALAPGMAAKAVKLHSSVDATLQQLTQEARKEGISVAPVDKDFTAPPATVLATSPTTSAGDNEALFVSDQGVAGDKLAAPHFTSFALTSQGNVRTSSLSDDATQLQDGAVITNAHKPVARIAIPLGAHQDATKDRKEGRSWKSLRRPPKVCMLCVCVCVCVCVYVSMHPRHIGERTVMKQSVLARGCGIVSLCRCTCAQAKHT